MEPLPLALVAWLFLSLGLLQRALAGETLLSMACDVNADLLVMGFYGHSRARELVMGGASRSVLRSMTVPVLMSH